MVEVIELKKGGQPPTYGNYVYIIKAPSGLWVANGATSSGKNRSFWSPPGFATHSSAIYAAVAWADANKLETVYFVKEERAG